MAADQTDGGARGAWLTRGTRTAVLAAGALLLGATALPGSFAAEPDHSVAVTGHGRVSLAPADDSGCDLSTGLSPSTSDSGPAVQRIKQRGKLIVGIDTNSYLWGFRNPTDASLQGFDIDLVHALAKSILNDPGAVEFLAVPTANRIPALQSGQVDMVVRTMTISCARKKMVSFSVPYFVAGQEVIAPKSSSITGFDDSLKGKRVCAATGSTAADKLKPATAGGAVPHGAVVFPVANQLDCLVQMQLGNVDATITDNALGAGQAAQDPAIHLVGGTLSYEPYGVAMKLGADDLVRRVNSVLKDFLAHQWTDEYNTWLRPHGIIASAPVPKFAN